MSTTDPLIEPHLWVSDLGRSIRWYEEVLGFEVVALFPSNEAPTWAQLKQGRASLMLATIPGEEQAQGNQAHLAAVAERASGPGSALTLYLHSDDPDALYAAANAADAEVLEEIWDAWWGGRQFTVSDPSGNWWTVFRATD